MNKRMALIIFFALIGCVFSDVSHLRRQKPQTFQDKRDSPDQPIIFDGKQKVTYRPQAVQQVHYQSSFVPNSGPYVVSSGSQPLAYSKPQGGIEYAPSSFLKDGGVQYASGAYRGPFLFTPQPHSGPPAVHQTQSKPPTSPPGQPVASHSFGPGNIQQFSHVPPTAYSPIQVQEYSAIPHRPYSGGPVQYTFAPHQPQQYPQQIQYAIAIPADYDRHNHYSGVPIQAASAFAIPAHMLQYALAQGLLPQALKQGPPQPNQHHQQSLSNASPQHQYPQFQIIAVAPSYSGKGSTPQGAIYASPAYFNHQQPAIAFGIQPIQYAIPQLSAKHSAPPSSPVPQPSAPAHQSYQSVPSQAHQNNPISYTRFSQTLQTSPQQQPVQSVQPVQHTQPQIPQAQPKVSAPIEAPSSHIYPSAPPSQQIYPAASNGAKLSYALLQEAPGSVYSHPGVIHYGTHLYHPSLPGRLVAAPVAPTAAGPQTQPATHSANNVVKYP